MWAHKYEKLWVQKYSLGPSRKAIIQELETLLQADRSYQLLDMGCGTGQLIRDMKEAFPNFDISYRGVDASKEMIRVAEGKSHGIDYEVSTVKDFHVGARVFDIIVCAHSFPYYPDQAKTLLKLHGMLKDGGLFIIVQASQNNRYDKIALSLVKLTTSKAVYPSEKTMLRLMDAFKEVKVRRIKEKIYMPSILVFTAVKGENIYENTFNKTQTS